MIKQWSVQSKCLRLPEMALVTIAAVALMILVSHTAPPGVSKFALPCILAGAAIIPSLIRNEKLSHLGLSFNNVRLSLRLLCVACLLSGPIIFIFLLSLNYFQVNIPLASKVSDGNWPAWITYQLMYIAVAEELFFRGYILGNLACPKNPQTPRPSKKYLAITLGFSAALFALAHVILLQDFLSALTFFPGLLLGWLFIRTHSLLAPILFHAIANMAYALITTHLA